MKQLLISNAKVVNEGKIEQMDVVINNGRIEQIGKDLQHVETKQHIDASGKHLLPGLIDDQVHFREPGLTHKGDIAHESAAAVAGGITSFMEMPNCNPQTTNYSVLEDKYRLAATRSLANFSFYFGATNDNLELIKGLDPESCCGIKVFMGASTGNMLVDDPKILEQLFDHAPILLAAHCEDTPMITENEIIYKQRYGDEIPFKFHPDIRSAEACYKSSSMAVELAQRFGTKLHVLHLTTEKELALFDQKPLAQKQITAEACSHHLFFNEADYAEKGALIKCNPAIKKATDQAALQQAVVNGVIDVIATDHAPHTWEEKQNPHYMKAPSGLPLVQHSLQSLLEHYHSGTFSLELIVEKTSHAVAELYQIKERGYIREGYWADLVLVDIDTPQTVDRAATLSKCGWSPFDGYTFKSAIYSTVVNGELMYQNGKIISDRKGQRLLFNRS
ncbi:MAG: dihydroorotase [Pseudomonadales bacterium]|nr:dihydroorotase [Pseudomonadales bacterium]